MKTDWVSLDQIATGQQHSDGAPLSPAVENQVDRPDQSWEAFSGRAIDSSNPHFPRVSVIIPFTRREKIDHVLRAVLEQQYPSELLEIIVVGEHAQELADSWPSITPLPVGPIFRPGKARNLGARRAAGEVLLFLDDDCIPQPGWIEANLAELRKSSTGAVGGMLRGKSRNPFSQAVDFANFSLCQIEERQERPICTATFAIRKEVFDQTGGFDESLKVHEDIDYCHRLEDAGYRTVYQPKVRVIHDHGRETFGALVRYLFYAGNLGGLQIERRYREQVSAYKALLKFDNPALYALMVLPFALAATLRTLLANFNAHRHVVALAPLIFAGKLSCHIGILSWTWRNSKFNSAILIELRRLVEYTLFKSRFRTPRVITLFVTSHCNAKCGHCFYWMNLNQNNDMSFGEIQKLSDSLGKVDVLLISGGEPFLRKDLPEICELFFERNDLGQVNIPTNALQPKKTHEMLRRIMEVSRGRPVHLALSIDGTEEIHDEIRAVPGNFRKALQTFEAVRPLQTEFPNLRLRVNTTVLNKNYSDLFEFFEDHEEHFPGANTPSFSLLRGSPYDKSMLLPESAELRTLYEYRNRHTPGIRSFLSKLLDRFIFELSLETIRQETQVVPCEAGRIQGVVEDNGNVRHCELLPPIGNLREASFEEIWNSDHAKVERQKIANKECRCTHECFLYPSLLAHPASGLKLVGPLLRRR